VAALDLPEAPDFPDDDRHSRTGRAPCSRCAATVLFTWRTPAWQRASCLIWTILALCAAITLVLTGPDVPVTFGMRLPLAVLGCGGTWCAARWRRRVTVTTDEVIVRGLLRTRRIPRSARLCSTALGTGLFIAQAQRRRPVPMVTPWLVLTAVLGVALTTAKILTSHPQFADALLAGGAAVCLTALALCLRVDRDAASGSPGGNGGSRRGVSASERSLERSSEPWGPERSDGVLTGEA
jgi:hypothetical protein